MDILVWFAKADDGKGDKTIACAVSNAGVMALSGVIFSETPVYVIQISKTPKEFIAEMPEGIVACLFVDGLLQELELENKPLQ